MNKLFTPDSLTVGAAAWYDIYSFVIGSAHWWEYLDPFMRAISLLVLIVCMLGASLVMNWGDDDG